MAISALLWKLAFYAQKDPAQMDRRLVLIAACIVPADQPVVAFLERRRGEQGYLRAGLSIQGYLFPLSFNQF